MMVEFLKLFLYYVLKVSDLKHEHDFSKIKHTYVLLTSTDEVSFSLTISEWNYKFWITVYRVILANLKVVFPSLSDLKF
jgi:hypothetical protein